MNKIYRITLPFFSPIVQLVLVITILIIFSGCTQRPASALKEDPNRSVADAPFVQEYHQPFKPGQSPEVNDIRGIASDNDSAVWVATAGGVFRKKVRSLNWESMMTEQNAGPSYTVCRLGNGDILSGTWNGVYRYHNGSMSKEEGPEPPISVICVDSLNVYALGPLGVWQYTSGKWMKMDYKIARSVRDAQCDRNGNLWVATDAGLYCCSDGKVRLYQDTTELISCNVKGIAFDGSGRLWAGVMGGVSVRQNDHLLRNLTPKDGIPSAKINVIERSPDGTMWVGTDVGVVRYYPDGSHSLRFTKRWLTDDRVQSITFDHDGNAWIGTANGVSAIKRRMMTLAGKEREFYNQLMKRHIREPWTCGILRLDVPGDTATWRHSDDDNDGEYTGGYLAMESFRYAVTKDSDALVKAERAFEFLRFLQEVTGTEGFFARSIVPVSWTRVNDPNRIYTDRQKAEELVRDPRDKPVEERWRRSKDGKWLWKGDTSSDEMDGHMMSYFFFYELAANDEYKAIIRNHVRKIMDYLIKSGYNLIDIDGTHTRWSVWSPEMLNRDPDWASERSLNSLELLAYLKFTVYITGDDKYEKEYRRLIEKEGYLENAAGLNSKNPAWQIYFDRTMEGYLFPVLLKCEKDPELNKFYRNLADEWMAMQTSGENLINNFTYAYATGRIVNTSQSIEFLKDTPLDLVDWIVDHTLREDVRLVRKPILEELQVEKLPPASERSTVRWDKNPWAAVQGNESQVREPVFWLWPYWMARYLKVIEADEK
jgi:hypothetical protein